MKNSQIVQIVQNKKMYEKTSNINNRKFFLFMLSKYSDICQKINKFSISSKKNEPIQMYKNKLFMHKRLAFIL